MDKEIDIWKQRNEILHKKVNRQMDEIKKLDKKSETIFDLARRFPNKTYRELEKYREADRQEEAGACIMGEMRKDREEPSKFEQLQHELDRVKKENNDLFNRIAELTEVEESHRKMNGRLQERLTDVEEDNKKMAKQIEDKINQMRRSGL
mgnify:CR=1 FL=1